MTIHWKLWDVLICLITSLLVPLTFFAGTCSKSVVTSPSSPDWPKSLRSTDFCSTRRSPRLQQKNIASRDSPKSPGSTYFCSTRHSPRLQQKNAASRRQMLQPSSSRLPNGAAYNRSMYPLSEPGDLSGVHLCIEFNLSFRLISN